MAIDDELKARAGGVCEMCSADNGLHALAVAPQDNSAAENCVFVCGVCAPQILDPTTADKHHWTCLNETAWSQEPAVQVVAWRMLNALNDESWAQDLLGQIYLEDATLAWAQSGEGNSDSGFIYRDCNGAVLTVGDNVSLIKDLNVKGAGFTAKRGTIVRGISLVQDNEAHIEGRVNGQQIVILTEFVKKSRDYRLVKT